MPSVAAFRSERGQLLLQQLVPPSCRRSWAQDIVFFDAVPVKIATTREAKEHVLMPGEDAFMPGTLRGACSGPSPCARSS